MTSKKSTHNLPSAETETPTNNPSSAFAIIDIEKLIPNPEQPRQHFIPEVINELTESLKELGFINPITVRDGQHGTKIIIAGEQRYRAAKQAGIEQIPCIVRNDENAGEISIVENMLRKNLTVLEEAEALARLVEQGVLQKELAKKLGKSTSTISEMISLTKLPKFIKDECRHNHNYAFRELKKIVTAKDEVKLQMFEKYKGMVDVKLKSPRKSKRSASAALNTAVKSLSSQLAKYSDIDKAEEKQAIAEGLKALNNKISILLSGVRHVEVQTDEKIKPILKRRSK
jgi:ParB/RepB/Spo0J family partition protein